MPSTNTQNIYIQINPGNVVRLYGDAAGTQLLNPDGAPQVPQHVKSGGKLQFSFIRPTDPQAELVVGDIIVIAQHTDDESKPSRRRKDSPFSPPHPPIYYIPSPSGPNATQPLGDGSVPAGSLNIRGNGSLHSAHKFSIVLLCNDAAQFIPVDPTVIINP